MTVPELDVDGLLWRCVYEIPDPATGIIQFGFICPALDRNVQLRVEPKVFIAAEDMHLAMTQAIRDANNNYGVKR